jgi:aminoglycoside 3-N-acetyltransferase
MTPQSPLSRLFDDILLSGELLARHVYWRIPGLRHALSRSRKSLQGPIQVVQRGELRDFLREIGVVNGALTMAHTAVTNLRIEQAGKESTQGGFLATAKTLVDLFLELLGPSGTLAMPTNPQYIADDLNRSFAERNALVLPYDPLRTPCTVGMANELFWRRKGTLRSLHPYNPLAVAGPLAEELLRDNLNDREPLPHGHDSSYYRFCSQNGLVASVGVPLWRAITVIHVAEEIRDAEWPIGNFFERRRYAIRIAGKDEIHVVRQRNVAFGTMCICNRKVRRDLLREGILHEGKIGGAIVDWASARDVFEYFMERNRNSHYPYFGVNFMRSEQ